MQNPTDSNARCFNLDLTAFPVVHFPGGFARGSVPKKTKKGSFPTEWGPSLLAKLVYNNNSVDTYSYLLIGGLEHEFYFSIYWEFHHPN